MSLNYGGSRFDPHYAVYQQVAAQQAAAAAGQSGQSGSGSSSGGGAHGGQQRQTGSGYDYAAVTNPFDPASLLYEGMVSGDGGSSSSRAYRLTQPAGTAAGPSPGASAALALNAYTANRAVALSEPDPLSSTLMNSSSQSRAAAAAAYSTYAMQSEGAPGFSWEVYLPKTTAAALLAVRERAPQAPLSNSSATATAASVTSSNAVATNTSSSNAALHHPNSVHNEQADDPSISALVIEVPGVSLDPLSGSQVLDLVRTQTDDVVTRYLPCVDFLVNCQQELRAGLALAIKKRLVGRHFAPTMTPNQFYHRYIEPLPTRFYHKNKHLMETRILDNATKQIVKLCGEAKSCHISGCESMKNSFLGGMRENRSWGLRKWLSENGGALKICNDLELVLQSIKNLAKQLDSTKKMTELIRPMAKQAYDRLKNDVPAAYQEVSSAHPFLPFFHRLESALNGLANYDPDDDDVICIDDSDDDDDDDIQEVKKPPPIIQQQQQHQQQQRSAKSEQPSKKRSYSDTFATNNTIHDKNERYKTSQTTYTTHYSATTPDDDEDSDIEIVEVVPARGEDPTAAAQDSAAAPAASSLSPGTSAGQLSPAPPPLAAGKKDWRCPLCTYPNKETATRCVFCKGGDDDGTDLSFDEAAAAIALTDGWAGGNTGPPSSNVSASSRPASSVSDDPNAPSSPLDSDNATNASPDVLIQDLQDLATFFDKNKSYLRIPPRVAPCADYWNKPHHYAYVLRLLQRIIQHPTVTERFIDPVDETELFMMGGTQYRSIIKSPICFRDILAALDLPRGIVTPQKPSAEGRLVNCPALRNWNMWNGRHLLEAIDLIFLNALAYNGKAKTSSRTQVQQMRRILWDGINENMAANNIKEHKKHIIPTKRGETSGFVVVKKTGSHH